MVSLVLVVGGVSRLRRFQSVSELACYEEMRTLERVFEERRDKG